MALRITPAYTGKRPYMCLKQRIFWDHPRIHGEKPTRYTEIVNGEGSPPHTRGKD